MSASLSGLGRGRARGIGIRVGIIEEGFGGKCSLLVSSRASVQNEVMKYKGQKVVRRRAFASLRRESVLN